MLIHLAQLIGIDTTSTGTQGIDGVVSFHIHSTLLYRDIASGLLLVGDD